MKLDKKYFRSEFILSAILILLIIIMFIVIFMNKDKGELSETSVTESEQNGQNQENMSNNTDEGIEKYKEEKAIEEEKSRMAIGGKVCKKDENVVYVDNDSNKIYMYNLNEKKGKTLATMESKINKIYFDGNYVYCLPDYFTDKSIYSIDMNGNVKKIYNGSSLQLCLKDNKIYFVNQVGYDEINQNPQGTLCVMNIDGTDVKELAKSVKNYFYIENDKIYYTTQNRQMFQMNMDGTNQIKLDDGRKFPIAVSGNNLFYIDYANNGMSYQMNIDTKEVTQFGIQGEAYYFYDSLYIKVLSVEDNSKTIIYKFNIDNNMLEELVQISDLNRLCSITPESVVYVNTQNQVIKIDLNTKEQKMLEDYTGYQNYLAGTKYNFNKETQSLLVKEIDNNSNEVECVIS